MAKRRRRRGTWFPNVGTSGPGENADDDDAGRWLDLPVNNDGTSNTVIFDLTFDSPIEDEAIPVGPNARSLADIIGSEYILRRIVGKCFVAQAQDPTIGSQFATVVTAGFFVARAEDSSSEAAGNAQPIGTETALETRENYSPAAVSTVREPWIWRRRWILGNYVQAVTSGVRREGALQFPPSNALFHAGGVMDGPHIDAHTIRRVSQDDRLWFSISARALGGNFSDPFSVDITGAPLNIAVHLDYRLFGSLMKAKQKGSF